MVIEVPNEDPILDPSYAASEAQRVFGDHLDTVAELRDYGRELLKRLMSTSVRHLPDLVVVAGLLRQTVVALDAWHLCATSGAAQASRLHLRSSLEAFLYTEWILVKGKEPWARRLYVANVRDNRRAARRLVPGTEEHRLFHEAWRESFGHDYVPRPEAVEAAAAQDRNALDTLEQRNNEHVYREFEAFVAKHDREPEWYQLGTDGVGSIFALASALGRRAEYYALYEVYSAAAHGTRTDLHFRKEPDGRILLEPVRNPAGLRDDVSLAVSMPLRTYLLLIEHYRPAERPAFVARYAERWRRKMVAPKVEVNVQAVSFG